MTGLFSITCSQFPIYWCGIIKKSILTTLCTPVALSTDDIKDGIETRNHGNYEKNIYFNEEDKYISVVELIYIKIEKKIYFLEERSIHGENL